MVIKRIEPLSFAKIAGALYALMGLVLGCIFSLVAMAGAFGAQSSRAAGFGAIIGTGAIIFLPILYGVLGFIGTLIAAWLYNVVAGTVGGIELDVQ